LGADQRHHGTDALGLPDRLQSGPAAVGADQRPAAVGIVLFVIGSAECGLSASAGDMITWRVAQAVGACAGVVLARAMVRDLYEGDRAAQMISTLITVMAIASLLVPQPATATVSAIR
jgi:MFS family permease